MSSIQAYKAHKQEGTLVSKVHKQLRGTRSAHLPKHPYISGCIIIAGYANQFKVTKIEKSLVANQFKVTKIEKSLVANQFKVTKIEKKMAWLLDMQWSH